MPTIKQKILIVLESVSTESVCNEVNVTALDSATCQLDPLALLNVTYWKFNLFRCSESQNRKFVLYYQWKLLFHIREEELIQCELGG